MKRFYLYAFIVGFIFSVIFVKFIIENAKKRELRQYIREEGPSSHFKKSGTPTLGGLGFNLSILLTVILTVVVLVVNNVNIDIRKISLVLAPGILFGFVGFLDDYLILVNKKNAGLSGTIRIILEIVIAASFFIVYLSNGYSTIITVFGLSVDLKWVYGVLIMLMFIGSANALNLTDGLDGLASGLTVIVFMGILYFGFKDGNIEITIYAIIVIAALLGFIMFNFYPAKIFMGDVGSLALGASMAVCFIMLKRELLILIMGLVFIVETASVIIQVVYFKKTKGKRFFKMAPLHHHYELLGHKETSIVYVFYGFGLLSLLLGIVCEVFMY